MPYRDPDTDPDDDDADDRELPDAADADESDDPQTVPCPYCGKGISEDAELCPHCRSFISAEDAPPSRRRPWWVLAGAVACLAAVVLVWVL